MLKLHTKGYQQTVLGIDLAMMGGWRLVSVTVTVRDGMYVAIAMFAKGPELLEMTINNFDPQR